ncbi:hypothetical protein Tco_0590893 [Tanacetum coccineum]
MEDLFTQAHNFIRADEENTENRLRDERWGIAEGRHAQNHKESAINHKERYVARPITIPSKRSSVHLAKDAKAQNSQNSTSSSAAEKGKNQSDWKQKVVAPKAGNEVLMIDEGWSPPHYQQNGLRLNTDILFISDDLVPDHCSGDDPLVIKAGIGSRQVLWPLGVITAPFTFSNYAGKGNRTITTDFMIVRAPSPYNVILGRPGMRQLGAIASMIHSLIKFPLKSGIAIIRGDVPQKNRCL